MRKPYITDALFAGFAASFGIIGCVVFGWWATAIMTVIYWPVMMDFVSMGMFLEECYAEQEAS